MCLWLIKNLHKLNTTKQALAKELNELSGFSNYSKKEITLLESKQKAFTYRIVDDIAKYFNKLENPLSSFNSLANACLVKFLFFLSR